MRVLFHSYPATFALSTRILTHGQKETLTLIFLLFCPCSVPSVRRRLRLIAAWLRYVLRTTFYAVRIRFHIFFQEMIL